MECKRLSYYQYFVILITNYLDRTKHCRVFFFIHSLSHQSSDMHSLKSSLKNVWLKKKNHINYEKIADLENLLLALVKQGC